MFLVHMQDVNTAALAKLNSLAGKISFMCAKISDLCASQNPSAYGFQKNPV